MNLVLSRFFDHSTLFQHPLQASENQGVPIEVEQRNQGAERDAVDHAACFEIAHEFVAENDLNGWLVDQKWKENNPENREGKEEAE